MNDRTHANAVLQVQDDLFDCRVALLEGRDYDAGIYFDRAIAWALQYGVPFKWNSLAEFANDDDDPSGSSSNPEEKTMSDSDRDPHGVWCPSEFRFALEVALSKALSEDRLRRRGAERRARRESLRREVRDLDSPTLDPTPSIELGWYADAPKCFGEEPDSHITDADLGWLEWVADVAQEAEATGSDAVTAVALRLFEEAGGNDTPEARKYVGYIGAGAWSIRTAKHLWRQFDETAYRARLIAEVDRLKARKGKRLAYMPRPVVDAAPRLVPKFEDETLWDACIRHASWLLAEVEQASWATDDVAAQDADDVRYFLRDDAPAPKGYGMTTVEVRRKWKEDARERYAALLRQAVAFHRGRLSKDKVKLHACVQAEARFAHAVVAKWRFVDELMRHGVFDPDDAQLRSLRDKLCIGSGTRRDPEFKINYANAVRELEWRSILAKRGQFDRALAPEFA